MSGMKCRQCKNKLDLDGFNYIIYNGKGNPYYWWFCSTDCLKSFQFEQTSEFLKHLEEVEHLKKTGIPRCPICKVDMVNAVDKITGDISKYLWETNCEHSKNLRLSMG